MEGGGCASHQVCFVWSRNFLEGELGEKEIEEKAQGGQANGPGLVSTAAGGRKHVRRARQVVVALGSCSIQAGHKPVTGYPSPTRSSTWIAAAEAMQ